MSATPVYTREPGKGFIIIIVVLLINNSVVVFSSQTSFVSGLRPWRTNRGSHSSNPSTSRTWNICGCCLIEAAQAVCNGSVFD